MHMGRGGLYYRKTLGEMSRRSDQQSQNLSLSDFQTPDANTAPIDSTISSMVDSSSIALLDEINEKRQRARFAPMLVILAGVVFTTALFVALPFWVPLAILVGGVALSLSAHRWDELRKTTVLMYDLDTEAQAKYGQLLKAFDQLSTCSGIWRVPEANTTADWKRHAGAAVLVARTTIRPTKDNISFLRTNLAIPQLRLGSRTLAFLPDTLLVFDKTSAGSVAYSDLEVSAAQMQFIEDGPVGTDVQIMGERWRYVRKDGGPDLRFRDNHKLPIVLYGMLHLYASSGINEYLQVTRLDVPVTLCEAIRNLATPFSGRTVDAATTAERGGPSVEALQIIEERARGWEFRLFAQCLADEMAASENLKVKYLSGEADLHGDMVDEDRLVAWLQQHMQELEHLANSLTSIINERLPLAWGEPGQPGDAAEIMNIAADIGEAYRSMLKWTIQIRSTIADEGIVEVAQELATLTCKMIAELEDVGPRLSRQLDVALSSSGPEVAKLVITFAIPDTTRLLTLSKSVVTQRRARHSNPLASLL
jgi:hypothetical protein